MIMIQIYSSELFLREKDKNCVNSDQYTEYFEDIWGSKVGSIEIPESYITCLVENNSVMETSLTDNLLNLPSSSSAKSRPRASDYM